MGISRIRASKPAFQALQDFVIPTRLEGKMQEHRQTFHWMTTAGEEGQYVIYREAGDLIIRKWSPLKKGWIDNLPLVHKINFNTPYIFPYAVHIHPDEATYFYGSKLKKGDAFIRATKTPLDQYHRLKELFDHPPWTEIEDPEYELEAPSPPEAEP